MSWKIEFYNEKIEANILNWPEGILAKYLWISDNIEKFGPREIGMPHVKPLSQGLFEIRAKGKEGIGRAMFCMIKGKVIIILSEFIKKTKQTPPSEMELARKRMAEVKKNG